jgi:DNA-directed RNA polymerase specialized sigma subunit
MSGHADDQIVTNLLAEWRRGDEAALARLIPIVYQELRRVAGARLRGAQLMREILVDHARRRNALKRGITAVRLDEAPTGAESAVVEVLALDEALTELASLDERLCRVVELRYFAGLSIAETADALEVSPATVERDWTVAKAWLLQRLSSPPTQ